jgi:hypothetical protein
VLLSSRLPSGLSQGILSVTLSYKLHCDSGSAGYPFAQCIIVHDESQVLRGCLATNAIDNSKTFDVHCSS